MKRRAFLKSSITAGLIGSPALKAMAAAAPDAAKPREFYELRTYTLKPAKKPMLDEYLSKAFMPALQRAMIGPVGVFTETLGQDQLAVHVLIVAKSAADLAGLGARINADAVYRSAAATFLAAPASDPVYDRIESSLLGAIDALPHIEKPDSTKPRLLNLRIYESHNERAAAKKIEMFGLYELAIFRRVGLTPVLFGETLIGPRRPNLTYLLVFPDDAARKAAWSSFGGDDAWKKLKAIPEYADKEIVSHITNKLLTPEPYSGI
jgi:preprotein translocase subunit Sss1